MWTYILICDCFYSCNICFTLMSSYNLEVNNSNRQTILQKEKKKDGGEVLPRNLWEVNRHVLVSGGKCDNAI